MHLDGQRCMVLLHKNATMSRSRCGIIDATDGDKVNVWLEELKRRWVYAGNWEGLGLGLQKRLAGRGWPRVCFGAGVSGPIVGC